MCLCVFVGSQVNLLLCFCIKLYSVMVGLKGSSKSTVPESSNNRNLCIMLLYIHILRETWHLLNELQSGTNTVILENPAFVKSRSHDVSATLNYSVPNSKQKKRSGEQMDEKLL